MKHRVREDELKSRFRVGSDEKSRPDTGQGLFKGTAILLNIHQLQEQRRFIRPGYIFQSVQNWSFSLVFYHPQNLHVMEEFSL